MKKHLRILLLLLFALIPVGSLFLEPTVSFYSSGSLVILCSVATIVVGLVLAFWGFKRNVQVLALCLALFLLLAVVSTLKSIDGHLSQLTLITWMGSFAVFFGIQALIKRGRDWRWAAYVILAGGFILCFIAASRSYEAALLEKSTAFRGTFVNPDCFAVVPLACYFLVQSFASPKRITSILLWGSGLLVFGGSVLMSESRAALVGLLAGQFLYALLLAFRIGRRSIRGTQEERDLKRILAMSVIAPVLALGVLWLMGGAERLESKMTGMMMGTDVQSVQGRLDVLEYGWETALNYPWIGSGPGTFALAYQQYRPHTPFSPDREYMNMAHDDYIEIAVETGFIGLITMLVFFGYGVYRGSRLSVRSRKYGLESAGAVSAVAAVCVFALGNFAFSVPSDQFYWFACLALAVGVPTMRKRKSDFLLPWWGRGLIAAFCLLLGLWGIYRGSLRMMAYEHYRTAQVRVEQLNWDDAVKRYQKALEYEPNNAQILNELGKVAEKMGYLQGDSQWLQLSKEKYYQAMEISPFYYYSYENMAELYASAKEFDQAREMMLKAQEYAPYHRGLNRRMAKILLMEQRFEEALEELLKVAEVYDKLLIHRAGGLVVAIGYMDFENLEKVLDRWFAEEDKRDVLDDVLRAASSQAEQAKYKELSLNLSLWNYEKFPDDVCAGKSIASLLTTLKGKEEGRKFIHEYLEYFERSPKEATDCFEATLALWTQSYQEDRKYQLRYIEEFVVRHPYRVRGRIYLSGLFSRQGDFERSVELTREGLEYNSRNYLLLRHMGDLYRAQDMKALAKSYYKQALEVNPDDTTIKTLLLQL